MTGAIGKPGERNAGFTLMEVMVAVALGSLVIAMAVSIFLTLSISSASTSATSVMHAELIRTVAKVTKDLRATQSVLSYVPSYPSHISLNVVASNGTTNMVNLQYTMGGSGGTLMRSGGGVSVQRMAEGMVTRVVFTLYGSSGAVVTNPASATSIGMKLWTSTSVRSDTYGDVLSAVAKMRNKF